MKIMMNRVSAYEITLYISSLGCHLTSHFLCAHECGHACACVFLYIDMNICLCILRIL